MTEKIGPHRRVARRPPDPDLDVGDAPEDMEVVRLECLDCGHEIQSLRQIAELYLINEISCGDRHSPDSMSVDELASYLTELATGDPYKRDWGRQRGVENRE